MIMLLLIGCSTFGNLRGEKILSNKTMSSYKNPQITSILSDQDAEEVSFYQESIAEERIYKSGEIIIKFKHNIQPDLHITQNDVLTTGYDTLDVLNQQYGVYDAKQIFSSVKKPFLYELSSYYKFFLKKTTDMDEILHRYRNDPHIEYAGLNYMVTAHRVPNDPYYYSSNSWNHGYADLWGLHRMHMAEAWDVSTGSSDVVVAIVDSGVDYAHPDLADNQWLNDGEDINHNGMLDDMDFNGVDDDRNGYIDDLYGWNFVGNNNTPMDDYGHGTHCAGTISAVGNNTQGITGVCWECSIMAVKALDEEGSGWPDDIANALCYAADNGADIISNSWGFNYRFPYEPQIAAAVRYAYSQGCILFFSAGNCNDDVQYYCPQNMDEVITVGATDHHDRKAWFSNWGENVMLSAPGVDILSLRGWNTDMYRVLGGAGGMHFVPPYDFSARYYWANGTSMACPHAAGVAALLLSKNTSYTRDMIKTILICSGDQLNSTDPIGLRINASSALSRGAALADIKPLPGGGSVEGFVSFMGSAWGEYFKYYTMLYGYGRTPSVWVEMKNSSISIVNGTLASVDVNSLTDGYYTILLTVVCTDGVYTDSVGIVVNNNYNVFYVDDDNIQGPWFGTPEHPFRFVTDAVITAGNGDDVVVFPGHYTDHIVIERSIRLTGLNKSTTILELPWYKPDEVIYINEVSVQVSGFTINATEAVGIKLDNALNSVVTDNIFRNIRSYSIWGKDTTQLSLVNNTIYSGYSGIYLSRCSSSRIVHNVIWNTSIGIILDGTHATGIVENNVLNYRSQGITISGCQNKVYGNTIKAISSPSQETTFGLMIRDGSHNSIVSNLIQDNTCDGVHLYRASYNGIHNNTIMNNRWGGVGFFASDYNIIKNNTVVENTWYGILLNMYADTNIIQGNTIQNNRHTGVWVYELCFDNLIYHNKFISNLEHNGYDNCINTWYNPVTYEGNYYDDYTGGDADGDGIGDTSYTIPGADNRDHYPLMYPYLLGDVDCDWMVSFADIDAFIIALSDYEYFTQIYLHGNYWAADCNRDGKVTFDDIDLFVMILGS